VKRVSCIRINIIWFKTTKDYLEFFKSCNLFDVIFDNVLEVFYASNISWPSNHMLCAIAFKPIESHESFANLNVGEFILEIIEKMGHCYRK